MSNLICVLKKMIMFKKIAETYKNGKILEATNRALKLDAGDRKEFFDYLDKNGYGDICHRIMLNMFLSI